MRDDINWSLLARYFGSECTPEEAEELAQWIAADPERSAAVRSLRETWEAARSAPPERDANVAWERFSQRMNRPSAPVVRPLHPSTFSSHQARRGLGYRDRRLAFGSVAAALLIAVATIVAQNFYGTKAQRVAERPNQMREVTTARGQRARVRLGDGTQVILAPASQLRFIAEDDRGARDVYLEGEAFFEVTHDASRPFRVHTSQGIAEDLGTKFNVQAYVSDTVAQVVVAEGSVALHAARGSVGSERTVLGSGELGRVTTAGRMTVVRGVNVGHYMAWTDGHLIFRNTPLRSVVRQLSRWYNLDFKIADDSLGDRLLTASFTDEPPAEVLDFITLSLGVRYERQGRTVVFSRKARTRE